MDLFAIERFLRAHATSTIDGLELGVVVDRAVIFARFGGGQYGEADVRPGESLSVTLAKAVARCLGAKSVPAVSLQGVALVAPKVP